jgi:hypothetical protein
MMPKCRNPECQKEIAKGLTYCGEDCLKRHLELIKIRPQETENRKEPTSEGEIWLGQGRRKRAMETIIKLAKGLLPMTLKKFACEVSYRTGLSLRKVMDDYLEVLMEVGILKINGNVLSMAGAETA